MPRVIDEEEVTSLDGTYYLAAFSQTGSKRILPGNLPFTQSGTGAVASTVQTELRYVVRPEQFGALGDGIADDTAAIVKSIARIPSSGGILLLGNGATYKVTFPTTQSSYGGTAKTSFTLKSHLWVCGDNSTIIQANSAVTSAAPSNTAMFFSNQHLSDIRFSGITFDMNGANNSLGAAANYFNCAVAFSGDNACCDDLVVDKCKFLNWIGVQVLMPSMSNTANSALGVRNLITNNYLYMTKAYNLTTDMTAIGGVFNDSVVDGNHLEFDSIYTGVGNNIGVMIDLQGRNNRVTRNKVVNFAIGVQIGANHTTDTYGCIVSQNIFSPVKYAGVNVYHGDASEKDVGRLLITDNIIDLEDLATGANFNQGGVVCNTAYTVNDVTVSRNIIRKSAFVNDASGIAFMPTGCRYDNINIFDNQIINLYVGVDIQTPPSSVNSYGSVAITNNTFRNIRRSTNINSIGIKVYQANGSTMDSLHITGNRMVKDAAGGTWDYGHYIADAGTGETYAHVFTDGNLYNGPTTPKYTAMTNGKAYGGDSEQSLVTVSSRGTDVFALDTSGQTFNIADNASQALTATAVFSGLVMITETANTGACCFAMCGGGGITIIAQTAAQYVTVATGTGAGKTNLVLIGGVLTLENKEGAQRTFNTMLLRNRAA